MSRGPRVFSNSLPPRTRIAKALRVRRETTNKTVAELKIDVDTALEARRAKVAAARKLHGLRWDQSRDGIVSILLVGDGLLTCQIQA